MITSTRNPRIMEARKLAQRKHRQRQNRFLVEGLQLLALAVEEMPVAGRVRPLEVFYSQDLFTGRTAPRLLDELTAAWAEPVAVAPSVLGVLSDRDTSQGLAATFILDRLEWAVNELLAHLVSEAAPRLVLVLDRLLDPGNLGTLIRTADAVGASAVVLLEPCVDPFDPKTVRSTMGSLFTIPISRIQSAEEILPQLAALGYRLVGADGARGETAWTSGALGGSVALVLGNEARGLSPELHRHLSDYVSLPLLGRAESLNVAVAGGTLMYEWRRVNGAAD
jgi:TrmH family RNA methyltransferase